MSKPGTSGQKNGAMGEAPMVEGAEFLWEKPKKSWLRRLFSLLCWLILLACGVLAWDTHRFLTNPASTDAPQEILFTVEPGATFDRVAWDLKKNGLITDVFRFQLLGRFRDAFGSVKAGEFRMSTGWTPEEVLNQITKGKPVLYTLILREGLTWWETARSIEKQGFARYEDFQEVIQDPAFLRGHHIPLANAEGFLFPETYMLKKPKVPLDKQQARELADLLVRTFWKKTAPIWNRLPKKRETAPTLLQEPSAPAQDAARETPETAPPPEAEQENEPLARAQAGMSGNATYRVSGQTIMPPLSNSTGEASFPAPASQAPPAPRPQTSVDYAKGIEEWDKDGPQTPAEIDPAALRRLLIMASLVEKETGMPEERARVAGVYVNRLRRGMLLQCDPTIPYGVGESFTGAIRRSQLEDEANPYNTYRHPGLPPGPICSSGMAALKAALQPERHDYLYFVATGSGDGAHVFTKTLTDHNRAVQEYRARMRARGN